MNASYRLNTCKSRGITAAAMPLVATGARVSNAYPTCPHPGNSLLKGRLTPDGPMAEHFSMGKGDRMGLGMRSIRKQAG